MLLGVIALLAMVICDVSVVGSSTAQLPAVQEGGGQLQEVKEQPVVQEVEERPGNILPSLIASSVALFQGRGKKGNNQAMGMAMMMGGMMIALALAALAALSGKAMAASMAALMLAAMSLMKKGSSGGHSSYEVISVPGGHHHRSLPASYPVHEEQQSGAYSEEVAERFSAGQEEAMRLAA